MKTWVEYELDGYPKDKNQLPSYRIFKVHSFGDFSGAFGSSMKNVPIMTPNMEEPYRTIAEEHNETEGRAWA